MLCTTPVRRAMSRVLRLRLAATVLDTITTLAAKSCLARRRALRVATAEALMERLSFLLFFMLIFCIWAMRSYIFLVALVRSRAISTRLRAARERRWVRRVWVDLRR